MIEQAQPSINECYLVPHGNIRMEAMGLDNRQPTDAELEKMRNITQRELAAGAFGISTGLIYMPCAYGHTEELIEICKVGAEHDVLKVSFDQYPYAAGSTMLGVILPPWVHDGGTDNVLKRLADKSLRQKMIHDIEHGIPGWDNFIDFAGLDGIYVTSVDHAKNAAAVGLNLVELGKLRHTDPYNAVFDLLLEEENAVGMVDFYGTEENIKTIMKRPEMNACTDGLLSGKPHPRVYGAFPRILGKYVRQEKTLRLEEAVYKMTKKAAQTFKIAGRGQLKPGFAADVTIFNQDTVIDKGTFTDPVQYPEGIEYVIVNGRIAVAKGKYTEQRHGRVLHL